MTSAIFCSLLFCNPAAHAVEFYKLNVAHGECNTEHFDGSKKDAIILLKAMASDKPDKGGNIYSYSENKTDCGTHYTIDVRTNGKPNGMADYYDDYRSCQCVLADFLKIFPVETKPRSNKKGRNG